jgi:hypothetical protein
MLTILNDEKKFCDVVAARFLPVSTTIGDGLTFPTRISATNMEAATLSYQSIASRNGNGDVDGEAPVPHQVLML